MIDDPLIKCKLTTQKNVENKNVQQQALAIFFMICIDELSQCFIGLSENQNRAHGCQLETK